MNSIYKVVCKDTSSKHYKAVLFKGTFRECVEYVKYYNGTHIPEIIYHRERENGV